MGAVIHLPQKIEENLLLKSGMVNVQAEKGQKRPHNALRYPVPGFPSLD
jgi:hypothetical protein